jgi:hypothetical protein
MAGLTYSVDIKAAEVLRSLGVLKDKQVTYVLVNTINKTAKLIQAEERKRVASQFKLRGKKEFILRQSAVIKFASVKLERYVTTVSVGQKKGLLLPEYEAGGTRGPTRAGAKDVAVPIVGGARPFALADIPESLYIKQLLGAGRGRARARKGQRADVFVKPNVGIFQRRGSGVRLLYAFTPTVRLPAKLGFRYTADRVVRQAMGLLFASEVSLAVGHAMGRGTGSKRPTDVNAPEPGA